MRTKIMKMSAKEITSRMKSVARIFIPKRNDMTTFQTPKFFAETIERVKKKPNKHRNV